MRHVFWLVLLSLLACGCGKSKGPLLSHGKPVAHWVGVMNDPDPAKRKQAVKALESVGTADPSAIPALSAAVKDPEAVVRSEAILALLRLGPAAKSAEPALEEALQDPDPEVRRYAEKALARIRGQ